MEKTQSEKREVDSKGKHENLKLLRNVLMYSDFHVCVIISVKLK